MKQRVKVQRRCSSVSAEMTLAVTDTAGQEALKTKNSKKEARDLGGVQAHKRQGPSVS